MLTDVIRNNAAAMNACVAGDFALAVASLEADTTERRDNTLRTTRWLMINLPDQADGQPAGTTEADVILQSLQDSIHPRVQAAYLAMSAEGIDLSDPQTQMMIPIIGANWPTGLVQKVAEAGVKTISVAEFETGEVPTIDSVTSAYGQIQVEDIQRDVSNGINESVHNAIASGDRAAVAAALRALATTVES